MGRVYSFRVPSRLVLDWPPFWVYTMLKIDPDHQVRVVLLQLRSRKWMKKITPQSEPARAR